MGPADVKRPLSNELDADDVAVNYYELAPGDSFGFGYHRHADQEEVFHVQRGTVTFETEDGDVDVSAGEAIRFAPATGNSAPTVATSGWSPSPWAHRPTPVGPRCSGNAPIAAGERRTASR